MNVLFLHQFDLDFAGGSGTYLRLLAPALAEMGHAVEVVSARRPDRHGCTTHALPFDFTLTFGPQRRPGERTFDDFTMDELRALSDAAARSIEEQAFGDRRPDLLLVNHISLMADVARTLSAIADVPYRMVSYGTDTQLLLRDDRYADWLGDAVSGSDRIFAISEFVSKEVQAVFPDASSKVDVLGGAVDHDRFRPGPRPERPDRVVFVGRLVTEKGIWTLLEAAEMLGDGVVLDVVGEGPLAGDLEEAVRRSPNRHAVNLLGYVPPARLREVLVRSTVAVVPSLWDEPLGLVVLEAFACGIPVVATAVGGIPEMVRHGDNGLLVDPGDPAALAGAIRRILHDSALHRHLREGCLLRTRIPTHADLARKVVE